MPATAAAMVFCPYCGTELASIRRVDAALVLGAGFFPVADEMVLYCVYEDIWLSERGEVIDHERDN